MSNEATHNSALAQALVSGPVAIVFLTNLILAGKIIVPCAGLRQCAERYRAF